MQLAETQENYLEFREHDDIDFGKKRVKLYGPVLKLIGNDGYANSYFHFGIKKKH